MIILCHWSLEVDVKMPEEQEGLGGLGGCSSNHCVCVCVTDSNQMERGRGKIRRAEVWGMRAEGWGMYAYVAYMYVVTDTNSVQQSYGWEVTVSA